MIFRKAVLLPILVILSIQGIIVSILYYQKQSEKISSYLTSETGKVAGASTQELLDLSKEIPIIPGATVASVDTSQNSASVTLDSPQPTNEIQTYYDDFMLLNGWKEVGDKDYQKDHRELKVEITDNIVKITINRI